MEQNVYWNLFAGFCLPAKKGKAMLAYFGGPKETVTATDAELEEFYGLVPYLEYTAEEKERIRIARKKDPVAEYDALKTQGIRFITQTDPDYPEALKQCFDAPFFLYYMGELPKKDELLISIVGARKCTPYGLETAKILAKNLCEEGMIGIVSGLALGVDRAAHEGALLAGGKTYAVLGCGIDRCYPEFNREIYEKIRNGGGAILSEYPPKTPPLSCFFPQRNRIIAGMSDGIVLTEARKKSGSLITAALGLEYGKNIYAVPGRVTDVLSEGCNYLIREGAKPVLSSRDILEDYAERPALLKLKKRETKTKKNKKFENSLASHEKIVYASLRLNLQHVEEIQKQTGLKPQELAGILESLAARGCIKRYGQAYYALSGED